MTQAYNLSQLANKVNTSGQLNIATGITGTAPVANGGTGQSSFTNGQLLIGNTTGNTLSKATLTAGSNITITNGAGSITISASGGPTTYVTTINGESGVVTNYSKIETSTTAALTNYALGTTLLAESEIVQTPNSSVNVYYTYGAPSFNLTSGTLLSGTWRVRGILKTFVDNETQYYAVLVQRIA